MDTLREELSELLNADLTAYSVSSLRAQCGPGDAPVFRFGESPTADQLLYPRYTMVYTPVKVHLRTLDDRVLDIDCEDDTDVEGLMRLIREKDSSAIRSSRAGYRHGVIFNGERLMAGRSLTSYGIVDVRFLASHIFS